MGPTLKVDSLLRLPYGCGEQNMVNFAPSIYIVKYLSSVEQLSESIENKAKNIMRTGNELDNYKLSNFEERCDFPFYIHDSYTGVGVQLELRAWEFNSARVTLHSSTRIQDTKTEQIITTQALRTAQPPDTKTQKPTKWDKGNVLPTKCNRTNLWGLEVITKIIRPSNVNESKR